MPVTFAYIKKGKYEKFFSGFSQLIGVFCLFLFINSSAAAHDNVVVIPLGGAVGDATQGDVIQGRTFSSKEGKGLSGTMPTQNLSDTTTAVSAGYYSATDLATVDPDLVPENIPAGVTIFGVTGTLTPAYIDNGDGTVTDTASNLMWQQADDGVRTWDTATTYCADLSLGGHNDWRLPTKDELKSLVRCSNGTITPLIDSGAGNPSQCGDGNAAVYDQPTINSIFSCHSYYYWSSSALDATNAWFVSFGYGHADWDLSSHNFFVRCVR